MINVKEVIETTYILFFYAGTAVHQKSTHKLIKLTINQINQIFAKMEIKCHLWPQFILWLMPEHCIFQ